MRSTKSLVSLAITTVVLTLLIPHTVFPLDIKKPKRMSVDNSITFQVTPKSFCVTEDNLFLFPDYQAGKIYIFKIKQESREKASLKYISEFNNGSFVQPIYCTYSQAEKKLAVIDFGARKIFYFKRTGKICFKLIKSIDCQRLSFDLAISEFGNQLIIPGNTTDDENNPIDLYTIDTESGKVNYLLPSYSKYGLKNNEEYFQEYRVKQTIPAIGIKAFIDIQGDNLYYMWEGKLRIIKFNLRTQKKEIFVNNDESSKKYIKPNPEILKVDYSQGDFLSTQKMKSSMSYVTDIFASANYLSVVYETNSIFRIQTYTSEGKFLYESEIPGSPSKVMWFDKINNNLYSISDAGENKGELSILEYHINY